MKERPILFSAPMIKAILDGRKVQTRRIVKPKHLAWIEKALPNFLEGKWDERPLPYGAPGDILWCRETWKDGLCDHPPCAGYRADMSYQCGRPIPEGPHRWRPAIHMPRWASRISLRVTEVRVQRLQDISEEDALAEGIVPSPGGHWSGAEGQAGTTPRAAFGVLWNSINGTGSWDANPWVWAISFERIAQEAKAA